MNILLLYQSPWWNAASYYTCNVIKALRQMNHKVVFAGKADTPLARNISEFCTEKIDIDLFTYLPIRFTRNIWEVKKLITKNNISIVIAVSAPGHILAGLVKKLFQRNLRIIKMCFDNIPPVNNNSNRYLHNKLTNYFLFPGTSTKNRYDKVFTIENFKILHAPLDLNEFTNYSANKNVKRNLGIPEDKIIVSFIGRFSPEKGIFFLIDIIKIAVEKSDKLFFVLSGKEGQIKHSDAMKKIDEMGLQKFVKIIDKMDDVRDLISITDIGLLTSRFSEFICRIAMEYMAFKVPVIAPRVNVIPEVVEDKKNGFIYEVNDSKKAAEYIVNLANDESLAKCFGENGFRRMNENYSLELFKKEFDAILKKLA